MLHLETSGRIDRGTAEAEGVELRQAEAKFSAEWLTASLGPLVPAEGERLQELAFAGQARGLLLPEEHAGALGPAVGEHRFRGNAGRRNSARQRA